VTWLRQRPSLWSRPNCLGLFTLVLSKFHLRAEFKIHSQSKYWETSTIWKANRWNCLCHSSSSRMTRFDIAYSNCGTILYHFLTVTQRDMDWNSRNIHITPPFQTFVKRDLSEFRRLLSGMKNKNSGATRKLRKSLAIRLAIRHIHNTNVWRTDRHFAIALCTVHTHRAVKKIPYKTTARTHIHTQAQKIGNDRKKSDDGILVLNNHWIISN